MHMQFVIICMSISQKFKTYSTSAVVHYPTVCKDQTLQSKAHGSVLTYFKLN